MVKRWWVTAHTRHCITEEFFGEELVVAVELMQLNVGLEKFAALVTNLGIAVQKMTDQCRESGGAETDDHRESEYCDDEDYCAGHVSTVVVCMPMLRFQLRHQTAVMQRRSLNARGVRR